MKFYRLSDSIYVNLSNIVHTDITSEGHPRIVFYGSNIATYSQHFKTYNLAVSALTKILNEETLTSKDYEG
jgi:hypothetical protein